MKIQSFKFSNHKENWHIEEVKFENLNLLVGGSGVGKTRILRALHLICNVAKGRNRNIDDLEWSINFSHLEQDYRWELKSSSTKKEEIFSDVNESKQTDCSSVPSHQKRLPRINLLILRRATEAFRFDPGEREVSSLGFSRYSRLLGSLR